MTDSTSMPQQLRDMKASEALALLEAEAEAQPENATSDQMNAPTALPLSIVEVVEELFQPREVAEHHVTPMVAALKAGRSLPPMLVYRAGARVVLLDGHHRWEAHRRAKATSSVPVEFFKGTPREAVLEARARNSTPKLPMSVAERMNDAWRLVKLGGLSKAQVSKAANVADSQVAAMRRALKALGAEQAEDCRTWREARQRAQGKEGWTSMSEDEREARLDAMAEEWTARLGKAFGTKLSRQPEIAARALAGYFGRRLPEVFHLLRDHIAEVDEFSSDDF